MSTPEIISLFGVVLAMVWALYREIRLGRTEVRTEVVQLVNAIREDIGERIDRAETASRERFGQAETANRERFGQAETAKGAALLRRLPNPFCGGEAGRGWIRQRADRGEGPAKGTGVRRYLWCGGRWGSSLVLARFVEGVSTHQSAGCPWRLEDRQSPTACRPDLQGVGDERRTAQPLPRG